MKKCLLASEMGSSMHACADFFEKPFSEMGMAWVPTASNAYTERPWMYEEIEQFEQLGFTTKEVDLEGKNVSMLREELANVDIVHVCGGNTFYLLHHMRKSGFDEVIQELFAKGVIYTSTSAGTVVAGNDVGIADPADDPTGFENESRAGLGFVRMQLLPHWGHPKFQPIFETTIQNYSSLDEQLISLTDNQVLLVHGNHIEIRDITSTI